MCLILKTKNYKKKQSEGWDPGGMKRVWGSPHSQHPRPHSALNPTSRSPPSILRSSRHTPQPPTLPSWPPVSLRGLAGQSRLSL